MLGTLKAVAQGIKSVVNFIGLVFDLVGSFVKQIGYLLTTLVKVSGIIVDTINYLPDWLKLYGTLTLLIITVYLILGRKVKGSGD